MLRTQGQKLGRCGSLPLISICWRQKRKKIQIKDQFQHLCLKILPLLTTLNCYPPTGSGDLHFTDEKAIVQTIQPKFGLQNLAKLCWSNSKRVGSIFSFKTIETLKDALVQTGCTGGSQTGILQEREGNTIRGSLLIEQSHWQLAECRAYETSD